MSQVFYLQFPRFYFAKTHELTPKVGIGDINFTVTQSRLTPDNIEEADISKSQSKLTLRPNYVLIVDSIDDKNDKNDVNIDTGHDSHHRVGSVSEENNNGDHQNGNNSKKNGDDSKQNLLEDIQPGLIIHSINNVPIGKWLDKQIRFFHLKLPNSSAELVEDHNGGTNTKNLKKQRQNQGSLVNLHVSKTRFETLARDSTTNLLLDDESRKLEAKWKIVFDYLKELPKKYETEQESEKYTNREKRERKFLQGLDFVFHFPFQDRLIGNPIGLTYRNEDDLKEMEEIKRTGTTSRMKKTSSMNSDIAPSKDECNYIDASQIGASSHSQDCEPEDCRLNNPTICWMPSESDQTTLDTWLRIDIGHTANITRISIQKSPDGNSWIKSFWIDYSIDCCVWTSHGMGEIQTNFNPPQIDENKDDVNYDISEHDIWPCIQARFIRIRPYSKHNAITIRMELYEILNEDLENQQNYQRMIQPKKINPKNRSICFQSIPNLDPNQYIMQLDCRKWVRTALSKAQISEINSGFIKQNRDTFLCIFSTGNGQSTDVLLNELASIGFGYSYGTMTLSKADIRKPTVDPKIISPKKGKKQTTFSDSVRSRQVVEQVVDKVRDSAFFGFDYVSMLIVASCIAGGGLATDNAVVVVASMLVSPLMGPVLSFSFGTTLNDPAMIKTGFINEIVSLAICVVMGLFIGIPYTFGAQARYDWPTDQMRSRGEPAGLADGAFIAAVSGVGVALSVLSDYVSAVVGVAISASLLPPAVNCGMLIVFATYASLDIIEPADVNDTPKDLYIMSGYSLLLTIENIFIIYIVSLLMFKVKEFTAREDSQQDFWKAIVNVQAEDFLNQSIFQRNLEYNNKNNNKTLKHVKNMKGNYEHAHTYHERFPQPHDDNDDDDSNPDSVADFENDNFGGSFRAPSFIGGSFRGGSLRGRPKKLQVYTSKRTLDLDADKTTNSLTPQRARKLLRTISSLAPKTQYAERISAIERARISTAQRAAGTQQLAYLNSKRKHPKTKLTRATSEPKESPNRHDYHSVSHDDTGSIGHIISSKPAPKPTMNELTQMFEENAPNVIPEESEADDVNSVLKLDGNRPSEPIPQVYVNPQKTADTAEGDNSNSSSSLSIPNSDEQPLVNSNNQS